MSETMNARESFLATFRFQPCPRTPRCELGYWSGAIKRWHDEGLPGHQQGLRAGEAWAGWVSGNGQSAIGQCGMDRDLDVAAYFGLDEPTVGVELNYNVCPLYEPEVLEETAEYVISRGDDGIVSRKLKPEQGMPEFIDYPVHSRQEWERFKAERYQPDLAARIPPNWDALVQAYRRRTYPLCLGGGLTGFFGTARQILGLERTLLTFYDDPAWMHDVFDRLADFYVTLYDAVLDQVDVDWAVFWEDMSYKGGSLISPRTFAEFMLKPYQKVTSLLRDHGVDIRLVDTDGDCRELIPLFIQGGITAMHPFEAAAGMDVAAIRRQYPRLGMEGGIDKRALIAGKEAIDRELEARVPVVLTGGYIPHVDHGVPADVSWENFRYYRQKLDAMLDEVDARRSHEGH